jgi:spermidine synthase
MGTLFPAATYAAVRHDASAGARVSLLYAAGTLGAIAGGLAGGFVLMPAAGLPGSVLVIAFLEVSASTLALRGSGRAWTAACSATAIAVLVLAGAAARTWRPHLMTAGVFQYAQTYRHVPAHRLEARLARSEELLFYRDGLTATVTVTRDRQSPNRDLYVSTNGKIDGSSHSDMPTQRLSAHLPLVLHPDPRDVCVIGLGTGCTAGSASLHPLRSLKVVEIEAAMVEAARFFASDNHGLLANPRVAVNVTDGRLFLRTRPADFDVVISEPSNPWLAGASDLFTREFFALGARALRPNGIFCQWVQLYGLAPENLRMLVRTFVSVFPHTVVATTIADTDILLIGSREPVTVDLARIAARMTQTDIAGDLADPRVGIDSPLQLVSRLRMGPMETRAFAGEGLLHTDDRPLIAYRAPRDLYRWTRHLNSALIARHARGIARYLASSPTPEETASALRRLAELYEAFMPGGQEAADTREIAARLEGLQGTDLSTAGR